MPSRVRSAVAEARALLGEGQFSTIDARSKQQIGGFVSSFTAALQALKHKEKVHGEDPIEVMDRMLTSLKHWLQVQD